MNAPAPVVESRSAVTLIGGAPVGAEDLAACLAVGPRLVAADSGADTALAMGHRPEAVIGDMDSIGAKARALLSGVLHRVAEQDSTDFEKCLIRIAAPLVMAAGFTGARQDHALAVFNTLVRYPSRVCVIVGAADVVTLAPPEISLPLPRGTPVSLFPMARVTGCSVGLEWPIDGLTFAPDSAIGTSNRATGPVTLETRASGMLLMLPRAALPHLLEGLAAAPRWPAR